MFRQNEIECNSRQWQIQKRGGYQNSPHKKLRLNKMEQNDIFVPCRYGGVESIRIHPRLMWTPDLLLYNRFFQQTFFQNTFFCSIRKIFYFLANFLRPDNLLYKRLFQLWQYQIWWYQISNMLISNNTFWNMANKS